MIFNEQRKMSYLNDENFRYQETAKEFITIIFRKAARVENSEGTDLADFNKTQIYKLLKSFDSKSKPYLRLVCTYFLDYYSWCIREGFVDKTNITSLYDFKIVSPMIDDIIPAKLVSDKYFTKNELLSYIEKVVDKGTKFAIYAIFSGVYGEGYDDLINLKISDIDKTEKTVTLISGKILKIDDLFITLAEEADKQTVFAPDGILEPNKQRSNVYVDSLYILKPCLVVNEFKVNDKTVSRRLRIAQQQIDNKFLNGTNLYFNGMVNFVKDKFIERNITLREALTEMLNKQKMLYIDDIQKYIKEFGSNMDARMFKYKIKDYLDYFED